MRLIHLSARRKMSYIAYEILLFTQNLVVHIQFETQIGNVLVKGFLVGSLASVPLGGKKEKDEERTYKTTDIGIMCTFYSLPFINHFLRSLLGVRIDMRCFHKHSLLVKCTGFEPSWEQRCPLVGVLRCYVITNSSSFIDDKAVIVLTKSQKQKHRVNC